MCDYYHVCVCVGGGGGGGGKASFGQPEINLSTIHTWYPVTNQSYRQVKGLGWTSGSSPICVVPEADLWIYGLKIRNWVWFNLKVGVFLDPRTSEYVCSSTSLDPGQPPWTPLHRLEKGIE